MNTTRDATIRACNHYSTLHRPERIKRERRDKRYQRWPEVDSLHKKGWGIREISLITELSGVAVHRWIQSKVFSEISTKPPNPGLLDPWQEWLEEQRITSLSRATFYRQQIDWRKKCKYTRFSSTPFLRFRYF